MAKKGKKYLKHCNYDSTIKFELASVGINKIILFFSDENQKNIIYPSLKAVQWFTIGGMSPPSGLAIGRSELKSSCVSLQPIINLDGGDVPPIVNHGTAFNDGYTMFF